MQIYLSTGNGVPIYQQIVSQVRYLVAANRLVAGEQLPPVRKLAEQLLVNPNTVARAYRELEAEGAVESRRGSGVFVSDRGSPLARRERVRILNDRIDALLSESRQLDVDLESLIQMIHQRDKLMQQSEV